MLVDFTIFIYRLLFVSTKVVDEKVVLYTLLHDFFDQLRIQLLKTTQELVYRKKASFTTSKPTKLKINKSEPKIKVGFIQN